MNVGWDRGRRVSGDLLYATLRDQKVYIEYDGIGYGISDDLAARGIPEDRIVLAFMPEAPTLADTQVKTHWSPPIKSANRPVVQQGV